MASVEFLQKRIDGKKAELDKLNKKLARIRKVEAQNWRDPNPYYYTESDLEYTLKDIKEVENQLANYESELKVTQEKDASRNIPIIIDFLNNWKNQVYKYYVQNLEVFEKEYKEYRAEHSELLDAINYPWLHLDGKEDTAENRLEIKTTARRKYDALTKEFDNKWSYIRPYVDKDGLKRLEKELDADVKKKYDFIIDRTNRIVGQITDASDLSVGEKGDLNGIIIGTNGKARVETIGAGGYNIQIYHFRTLIKPVK